MGKMMFIKMAQKVMKNGGKIDGFNNGPESYEKSMKIAGPESDEKRWEN